MVKGIGIDVASVARLTSVVGRHDDPALSILFTAAELDAASRSREPMLQLALCFAGKEAVGKALGTGIAGLRWNEIEVSLAGMTVQIVLYGAAERLAGAIGIHGWCAGWSRAGEAVVVTAMAMGIV